MPVDLPVPTASIGAVPAPCRGPRLHRSRVRLFVLAPVGILVGLVLVGLAASTASAHPLGNFTINTYSGIRVRSDSVLIDYVVDSAEIPTVQDRPNIDTNNDGTLSEAEKSHYATEECGRSAKGLHLRIDGHPSALRTTSTRISFPPGQAGLVTQRLECRLSSPQNQFAGTTSVTLHDDNLPNRIGWHEITAVGDGATLTQSDVPTKSISKQLTAYPQNRLSSPLHERDATFRFRPGGPRAPDNFGPSQVRKATDSFLGLVERQTLTVPFGLVAMAIAFAFGALHAVAPGHGKTVMAAYLVGEQGSRRQALLLGLTVAVTHTGGVFALALVITNSSLAPEHLYPLLGSLSGLLVAAIGVALLVRALRFRRLVRAFPTTSISGLVEAEESAPLLISVGHDHDDHDHDHDHDLHDHDHGLHDHDHGLHDHGAVATASRTHVDGADHPHPHWHAHPHLELDSSGAPKELRLRSLMAMGFAGGMVPTPSALVVLLGAIAIGRAWFGLLLIVAYGLGMATTLVTAGLVLERVRGRVEGLLRARARPRLTRFVGALPLITATLVVLGGLLIAARALKVV